MFLLILAAIGLCAKLLYEEYKKYTHTKIDTFFVMMDDGKCRCNSQRSNSDCRNKYCMGKLLNKIIGYIDSAETSISIAMYNITNHKIANSIMRASERNVFVRVITDKSMYNGEEYRSKVKKMKEAGVDVRIAGEPEKLFHHKFCLIDEDSSNGMLINGSLNWTYNGLAKNCENVSFIVDYKTHNQFKEAFNDMWKNIAKPLDTHTNNMSDQTKPFENKLQSGSGLDGTSLRSMSFCGESAFAQPNGYFNDSAVSAQRLQYKTVQDRLINSTKTN